MSTIFMNNLTTLSWLLWASLLGSLLVMPKFNMSKIQMKSTHN